MALKYSLKLILLKCIFEFMINTAPRHQLQTASMAEKNCFDMTKLIFQIMCVTVVQWSRSFLHVQINRVRLPATLLSVSLYHFFFCLVSFFNTIFPFGLFFFILTADPAGHALGSIYILGLSPEFYFGKGISKALDLHRAKLTIR